VSGLPRKSFIGVNSLVTGTDLIHGGGVTNGASGSKKCRGFRRRLSRSVKNVLSILRAQGFDVSEISRSTLNFQLNRLGVTKEKYASEKGTFQLFQKEYANEANGHCATDLYEKGITDKGTLSKILSGRLSISNTVAFRLGQLYSVNPALFVSF
jgi:hypothetical protein